MTKPTAFLKIAIASAFCLSLGATIAIGAPSTDSGTKAQPASAAASASNADADEATDALDPQLVAWADATDCAPCHETQAATFGEAENDKAAAFAAKHPIFQDDCTACHRDAALVELHETVDATTKLPKRLKKTVASEDACLTCHDPADLAKATADSTVLTDAEGTVVNPHDLPDVEDHATITCTSCHQVHGTKTVEKTATTTCKSCHHSGTYECGTCHAR